MSRRAPARADHEKFCRVEGWRVVRDARGNRGTHHLTFELNLPDGRILRTRVSRPPDRTTYGSSLFGHILRDQLDVTEEQFWACVRRRNPPDRGAPSARPDAIPADLVHLLVHKAGVPETEVARMSREQAVARINRFWTEGG